MILLDTNVVSELMREDPAARVAAWIVGQKAIHLGVSTIAIAEIRRGLARLPPGKRRTRLETSFTAFITEAFGDRIFVFDETAANLYGEIAAKREKDGFTVDAVDLMIAATARSLNAAIATRNTKAFVGCRIKLVDPWAPAK